MATTTPDLSREEPLTTFFLFANWMRQIAVVPITTMVVVICLIVQSSETLPLALEFSHMAGDSAWETLSRMLTGHFTHWSFDQLFWDVLAFAVLGYLCERAGRVRYLALLIASAVAVPFSVMVSHPLVGSYRGMSGVDSALFVFLACHIASEGVRNRDPTWVIGGLIAWVIFVSKVAFEYVSGSTMFVEASGEFLPLPISHLAGAVAGTLIWVFPSPDKKIRGSEELTRKVGQR
ncbi:MAG: rhomboid family intramembrane serine protease [Planctomycetota bacterium]